MFHHFIQKNWGIGANVIRKLDLSRVDWKLKPDLGIEPFNNCKLKIRAGINLGAAEMNISKSMSWKMSAKG